VKPIDFGPWSFKPAFWPSLAAAVMAVLTFSLGEWQTRRAQEKQETQAKLESLALLPPAELTSNLVEPADFLHRRARIKGRFLPEKTVFIDNRVYKNQPGYFVVTAMQIGAGNLHVAVNRGWVAANPRREILPEISTPREEQELQGLVDVPRPQVYRLAPEQSSGPVKQNIALDLLRERWNLALQPIVLLQTSDGTDGLIRNWPRLDAGADMHRAYALQWYVMSALTVFLWITLNLARKIEYT
jgi:surfeit locus 1 family protein